MALSPDFINELKYNNDIEGVVSSYVTLKRSGRMLGGLCPFHSEKTASFYVYPDTQSYYCFGCGAGGDVITFIRQIENLDYMEAVRFLAARAGMTVPDEVTNDKTARLKTRILEMNRELARFYHHNLMSPAGKVGFEYLRNRGMSVHTMKVYGLGYSLNDWSAGMRYLEQKGFTTEEMESAALVARGKKGGHYDLFRNRVMFPIIDLRGNVIGFGARQLDSFGPKYLNSSDTPVFKKSRNLFSLNFAKNSKEKYFILAEGYMDVISINAAGFQNTVATLGTSLTQEQARLISQYAEEVVISYDSDGPGQAATRRAISLLKEAGLGVRILSMEGAKDPDEYIKKFGGEKFRLLIEKSANSTQYQLDRAKAKYAITTPDGQVGFLNDAVGILAGISSEVERDVYIGQISMELGVSKETLRTSIDKRIKQRDYKKRRSDRITTATVRKQPFLFNDREKSENLRSGMAEERLIVGLIKNPDLLEHIRSRMTPEHFTVSYNRRLFEEVCSRIEQAGKFEMTDVSAVFDTEEMARLSRIIVTASNLKIDREEIDQLMNTIFAEQEKLTGAEDIDVIQKRIEELKKTKK